MHTRLVPLPTLSPTVGMKLCGGGGSKGSLRTSIPWDIHLCGWSYVKGHSAIFAVKTLAINPGVGAGGESAHPLFFTEGTLHPHYSSFKF